jgi:broad specificity phosphatase PhoE
MKLYLVRHGQSTGNVGGTLMGQSDHPLTALGEEQARAAAARLAPFGPMPVYSSDLPRARATAEYIVTGWATGTGDAGVAADRVVDPAGTAGSPAPHAIILEPRLREIDLGDYEGRPWEEFEADTALTAAFADDPYGTALPNGESLAHLEARVHAAVCDILAAFGLDDSGALCANAVTNADASAAAAGAEAGGTCAPAPAGASAVATGLLPVEHGESACIVAHDGPVRAILNHYLGVPPQKWWTLSTTHGGVSLLEFAGGCVTIRFVNATGHLDGLEHDASAPAEPDDEPAPTGGI